jgi:maltose 6'-phosphate phosphatase
MKTANYLMCVILLFVCLFISCCQTKPMVTEGNARCDNIAARGHINFLDSNVLFSEIDTMNERFKHIADFVAANEVDVILLQEIVGGSIAKTPNSAQDLRAILHVEHDLDFNISTAWEIGEPNIFSSANVILSRCEFLDAKVKKLPRVNESPFRVGARKKAVSFRRNLQLGHLDIPGGGTLNVYNTHLCARCDKDGRAEQLAGLLEIINGVETAMPGSFPSVLGGDFNFDRFDNDGAEKFMWEMIINNGFIDAYADFIIANSGGQETLDTLCEIEDNADEHCTVGVSALDGPHARRIDFVFAKSPAQIRAAKVVFNDLVDTEEPTVSDHAGVFISLELPQSQSVKRGHLE